MNDKTLTKLMKDSLKESNANIKVPKNLAAKISKRVSLHANKLQRKQAIWSSVKVATALLISMYALTSIIVNFMSGHLWSFLKGFSEVPSLLFTSEGLMTLYERLPLLSLGLFILAGVYVLRHLAIRGIKNNPFVFASVMTSFASVLVVGSFVAGMAVSSNSSDNMRELAGSGIFDPVINTVGQHDYSNIGTVKTITPIKSSNFSRVVLMLENGEERAMRTPTEILNKNSVLIGSKIVVVGNPIQNKNYAESEEAYSHEGLSLVDAEANSTEAMEVKYLKVLMN